MKLQIALDDITREAAKVLLEKIQEDVDIIEIGTPFAYYNDISVIQEFKNLYPKAKILADYKILDGGEFMSALAFRAGADIGLPSKVCPCNPFTTASPILVVR